VERGSDDMERGSDDMELRRVLLIGAAFASLCFGQSAGIVYLPATYTATPAFTTTAGVTNFSMTLGGNVTSSTFSSAATGTGSFRICQPSTGGTYTYTFAWMSNATGFPTVATGMGVCTTTTYAYDNGSVTLWATNVTGPTGPTGLTGAQGPSGSNGTGSGTLTSVATGCGLTGGPITVSGTISATFPIVVKTGSYTLLSTDCGNIEQFSGGGTATVPQAGSTGFAVPWNIRLQNTSTSSTVLVSTTTSVFYGGQSGSSFNLLPGQVAHLVVDGAGNWDVDGNAAAYTPVLISTSGPVADPGGPSYYQYNSASGALTFDLPAGIAGMQRCYRNATGKSGVITVAVTTSNAIDDNGANGTSGTGTLVSGGALGDAVCLVSDVANHWYAYVQKGTWTNN
jgi:hypothetical protein